LSDFKLKLKNWESDFFDRKFYSLEISNFTEAFTSALGDSDFDLIVCDVPLQDIRLVSKLEGLGFRTVDSRIQFLTTVSLQEQKFFFDSKAYTFRLAEERDIHTIIELTHKFLTYNKNFVSRYKSKLFFDSETPKRYYEKWITYSFGNKSSSTIIAEHNNSISSFFIIERVDDYEGLPRFKGILTAVKKEHRGQKLHLAMQSHLYKHLGIENFYLDNDL